MKNILFTGFLLIFFIGVQAQQNTDARQILDEVSKKTRSFKSISASFVFTLENEQMDIYEQNEGSVKLKGQKYVVELPDIGIKVFSDGKTVWNYMEDGNQVTISNMEESGSELMDPSSIFTIYEKGFQSKLIGDKKLGNEVFHEIELYPDSGEQDVSKIILLIGKADKMIKSALLYGTDGNTYGIEVTKMDTTADLPDSWFVFNSSDYGDVEIIDFR